MVQNVIIIGRVRGEKCNNLVPGLFLYFTSGCHCCQFCLVNHPTALKQHLPWNEIIEERNHPTSLKNKATSKKPSSGVFATIAASGIYLRKIGSIIVFPNVFLLSSSLSSSFMLNIFWCWGVSKSFSVNQETQQIRLLSHNNMMMMMRRRMMVRRLMMMMMMMMTMTMMVRRLMMMMMRIRIMMIVMMRS